METIQSVETKTCKKCGEALPLDQFHQKLDTVDGRDHRCRACKGVKDADWRKMPPDAPVDLWLSTYLYRWTCVRCDEWSDLRLVVNKTVVAKPTSVSEAKELARCGQVFCAECDHTAVATLKQRIKAKRRSEIVEERIAETDALVDVKLSQAPNSRKGKRIAYLFERSTNPDEIEGELLDIAADRFERRNTDINRKKELDQTMPYQTDHQKHMVDKREFTNFKMFYSDDFTADE